MQTNKKKRKFIKITNRRALNGVCYKIFRTDNMGRITGKNSAERWSAQTAVELKPLWEAAENGAGLPFTGACVTVSRPLL